MKEPTKIYLSSVACMNLMKPDKALNETLVAPSHSNANFLIIFRGTDFSHTAMEYLRHVHDQCIEAGQPATSLGRAIFARFRTMCWRCGALLRRAMTQLAAPEVVRSERAQMEQR